jgi:hypothetical protein
MSKIKDALEFLKDDLDKAKKQWREGEQFKSLLQREDKSLDKLLELFDPREDERDWDIEYNQKKRSPELRLYRKRMAFLKASRKEFHEEYDDEYTDVDFMRLLEIPYTDPKYAIEWTLEELQD